MAETIIFQSLPSRPAPTQTEGLVPWAKANLFANWQSTLTTIVVGGLLLYFIPQFVNWAILTATTVPNAEACRAPGMGACWGVITEKYRLIIFGRYPLEEQWRPLVELAEEIHAAFSAAAGQDAEPDVPPDCGGTA